VRERSASHHDAALTIIFTGFSDDYGASFHVLRAALFPNEALDAFVSARKAVLVDQFLPNPHRVTAGFFALFDEVAIWLATACCRRRVGGHFIGRFCFCSRFGVGGHPIGRFCRFSLAPPPQVAPESRLLSDMPRQFHGGSQPPSQCAVVTSPVGPTR
jgi:hypothetical protein